MRGVRPTGCVDVVIVGETVWRKKYILLRHLNDMIRHVYELRQSSGGYPRTEANIHLLHVQQCARMLYFLPTGKNTSVENSRSVVTWNALVWTARSLCCFLDETWSRIFGHILVIRAVTFRLV